MPSTAAPRRSFGEHRLMADVIDETRPAFHASLNVADLPRAIAFYKALLGVEPVKVRADYAKFELPDPALVLSLVPGAPAAGGNLNHAGLRVRNSEQLVAIQHRLEAAGLRTERERRSGMLLCQADEVLGLGPRSGAVGGLRSSRGHRGSRRRRRAAAPAAPDRPVAHRRRPT